MNQSPTGPYVLRASIGVSLRSAERRIEHAVHVRGDRVVTWTVVEIHTATPVNTKYTQRCRYGSVCWAREGSRCVRGGSVLGNISCVCCVIWRGWNGARQMRSCLVFRNKVGCRHGRKHGPTHVKVKCHAKSNVSRITGLRLRWRLRLYFLTPNLQYGCCVNLMTQRLQLGTDTNPWRIQCELTATAAASTHPSRDATRDATSKSQPCAHWQKRVFDTCSVNAPLASSPVVDLGTRSPNQKEKDNFYYLVEISCCLWKQLDNLPGLLKGAGCGGLNGGYRGIEGKQQHNNPCCVYWT